jgi:hypothetical protein
MRRYSDTVKVKTTKTGGGQTVLTEAGVALGSAAESKQVT